MLMASVIDLSAPFLGNVIEICIVTPNILKTMDGLLQLGIGPFQVHTFDPKSVRNQTYRGQASEFELKVAFAKQGTLTWELMQPISGPSIMAEFLQRNPLGGIHHIAFDCEENCTTSMAERKDNFRSRGFSVVQSGVWQGKKGTCEFVFFDTENATTTCFESYIFSPDWEDPENTLQYP